MKYTFKISHKIVLGTLVFLCCAIGLGGVSVYTLNDLTAKMETRNNLDEIVACAVEAQGDALDWLAQREELAMSPADDKIDPRKDYQELNKQVVESLDRAIAENTDPQLAATLREFKASISKFDSSFNSFHSQFNAGVGQVNGLRTISVQILGKALSLQKSIERNARKIERQRARLQTKVFETVNAADFRLLAQELADSAQEMSVIGIKRKAAAIILNKPLGFQEMAKNYILYKDRKNGSGLIVDIEKLLGIDKDATMGASYPQLAKIFPAKRENKLFNAIVNLTEEYYRNFKSYYALSLEMQKSMSAMNEARHDLQKQGESLRAKQVASYNRMQEGAEATVKGLTLAVAVIGMMLVFLNLTQIIKPLRMIINEISQVSRDLSNGEADLTYRMEVFGKGELGQLSRAFNRLMEVIGEDKSKVEKATEQAEKEARSAREALEGLHLAQKEAENARRKGVLDVVMNLEQIVEGLSRTSGEISVHVTESRLRASEQQERLAESSTALSQMTDSIQEVARSCSEAVDGAAEASRTATNGAELTTSAVNAIFEVKEQSDRLKSSLGDMNVQVADISRIMGVVSDIADQTNLLALNAAIEAARAGDAGRGFAVVADEVRNLAEKTMDATGDVARVVKNIQQRSIENVEDMDAASESIMTSTRLAEQAGQALGEIVGLVEEVTGQVQSISTAAEQQSVSSDQINISSQDINAMARATTESMGKSNHSAESLAELATELNSLISNLRDESKTETTIP